MSNNILVELSDALASAAEQAGKATVLVNARRRLPGSGVVYAANFILTADHILEREEEITIVTADGTETAAKLAGRDPGSDLALLRLERPASSLAAPAPEGARIGQLALALGRPSEEGLQASLGVISAIGGPLRTGGGGLLERYIRTDAISFPGFSGGPLVDASGQVLGINTSGLARGLPLTIPSGLAWQVASSLAAHGHMRRAYLGIRSQSVEIPASAQKGLKREQAEGLLIVGVEADSPASGGDLMVGDILVGIAGSPVRNHDELYTQLSEERIGTATPIELLRAGQPKVVKITVGERKP
jgi:S1-C subfamily serine protease